MSATGSPSPLTAGPPVGEPVYYEQYEIGHEWTTLGRTITEADVVLHAGQIGDRSPHHLDEHWSRQGPFGKRIAHGTMILAMSDGLMVQTINSVAFSYGYDRVRFIRPVFIGDTIYVGVKVTEKRPNPKQPGHGFVLEQVTVVNQHGDAVLAYTYINHVEMMSAGGAA